MPKSGQYSYFKIICYCAIALGIILRVINLASREFWYDEVLSLLLVTGQKSLYHHPPDTPIPLASYQALLSLPVEHDWGDMLQTTEKFLKGLVGEPHPPLFYIGQHLWLRWFGNSVGAMRSLPVLYSIGAIACAVGLGRNLLGYRGGLFFAALLSVSPFYLFHSLNVRMYCPLVFWTILSAWAIIELIYPHTSLRHRIFWSVILVGAVAAGFMTFYYFAFWVMSLGILVLFCDRKYWWRYALLLGGGIILTTPWLLWGTRQQLNNADLGRFATPSNLLITISKHTEGVLQTLGSQLVVGDWANILPAWGLIVAGVVAIALLLISSLSLWQEERRWILPVVFIMGIVPLLLMLGVDIVTGKFTVGFGLGRSAIFILPGCLLLIAAGIEQGKSKWRSVFASLLLIAYLSVSVGDFSLRSRWMFHQIADIIEQESAQPSLIVMNSNAWGHVMRLAYYLPESSSVMLLAQKSSKLTSALNNALTSQTQYGSILWLDSDRPVWGSPTTEIQNREIEDMLATQFTLVQQQRLLGTWQLDNFTARLYHHQ